MFLLQKKSPLKKNICRPQKNPLLPKSPHGSDRLAVEHTLMAWPQKNTPGIAPSQLQVVPVMVVQSPKVEPPFEKVGKDLFSYNQMPCYIQMLSIFKDALDPKRLQNLEKSYNLDYKLQGGPLPVINGVMGPL